MGWKGRPDRVPRLKRLPKGISHLSLLDDRRHTWRPWHGSLELLGELGSVGGLGLTSKAIKGNIGRLQDFVRRLRCSAPWLPLAAFVDSEGQMIPVSLRFRGCGVRAVAMADTQNDLSTLRKQLAVLDLLDVREWLLTCFEPRHPLRSGALVELGQVVAGHPSRVGTSGLRRSREAMCLPTLHRWRMVSRCLPVLLDLQDGDDSIEAAALRGGYSDKATFHRDCRKLFGRTPGKMRRWMGWEPLLAEFLGDC